MHARLPFSLFAATLTVAAVTHAAPVGAAPPDVDPSQLAASLTAEGAELAAGLDWEVLPQYSLAATFDPETGRVDAAMTATLPVWQDVSELNLRWFPGVVAEQTSLTDVTVDGAAVEAVIDGSIVTIPVAPDHGNEVEVGLTFSYVAPVLEPIALDPLGRGEAIQPGDIGLLARSDAGLMLGHWFPVWVPAGLDADPELDGFGDVSNFPAASIVAELTVPEGNTVVTGGPRLEPSNSEATTVTEGGVGLRDLAVVVMPDAQQVTAAAGDVEVIVTAPPGAAEADAVAGIAADSVATLSAALGPYPWTELDVVAVPLTAGVGGMEWPGMVWIETTTFEGGVPGLGDLGAILGADGENIDEVLGEYGEMLGLGDLGLMIDTLQEWTVAHEVGHMWWHAMVGNDSLTAPLVDEALAQHSACLVERELRSTDAEAVCDIHTAGQYEQVRMLLGAPDGVANQASDEFASSLQYGAVVYGKAPLFYRALEQRYGVAETTAALAAVVEEHAFEQLTPAELRASLGTALGDPAGVDELWQRWMEEAHGDEDVVVS